MNAQLLGQPLNIDERCATTGNSWWKVDPGRDVWHGRNKALTAWVKARLERVDNPVFVDIGAHTGLFTLLAAQMPNLRVYAFEPVFGELLSTNVALNHLEDRVTVFYAALGAENGEATMHIAPGVIAGHSTMSQAVPDGWTEFGDVEDKSVLVETLDMYALTHDIVPTVIKIDVEGMEKFVVEGGEQTIRQHKPAILVECIAEHTERFGYGPYQTTRLLNSWGYTCKVQGNDAACVWGDIDKNTIW